MLTRWCNEQLPCSQPRRRFDVRGFLILLDAVRLHSMNCVRRGLRYRFRRFSDGCDALSMPWRYLPRATRREWCCNSRSPASLASFEPCRRDCARTADSVSARDLARGEVGTCTEIARLALGTTRWGTLEAKRASIETCVDMKMSK